MPQQQHLTKAAKQFAGTGTSSGSVSLLPKVPLPHLLGLLVFLALHV